MESNDLSHAPFGDLVKVYRKRQRLTQRQLATRLDVHYNTVWAWERGDHLPDTRGLVLELARHLGLNESEARQLLEASLTAVSLNWLVPYPRNPFFTGREEILESLHALLCQQGAAALTQSYALHGLGGIGKTHLAVEYAYQHALEYSAVWWIRADSAEQIFASLLAIAEQLSLPERGSADQHQLVAAVQRWLSAHTGWLLIWDNLEDLDLVQRFLPATRQGAILLTTRAQALGPVAQPIEVKTMGLAEGTLFLLRRARLLETEALLDHVSHEQLAIAEAIVIEMDFLPLALDQAGAYIEEVGCSLSAYLELYRTHRAHLLRRRGRIAGDHPESVVTTWSLSFEHVEQTNPAAAELLRLCAFLEPETIPEELISEGSTVLSPLLQQIATDALALNEAIEELRAFSLVQRDPENRLLRLHRLVQAVFQDALKPEERLQWAERAVRATSTVFPETVELSTWPRCQRFLGQAQTCSVLIQQYAFVFAEAATLLYRVATYLTDAGLYEQAKQLYQQVLPIWEQTVGSEHPQVARSLKKLADLYRLEGIFEQAESLYQRALRICEQTLGTEHPDLAQVLDGLAMLYQLQARHEQAESLYQRALRICEQTLGTEHPDLARLLRNLTNLYREQGKLDQAELVCQRALSICEQTPGPEHPDMAHLLNSLATLYAMQAKFEQAEPLYQRALHIWEQTLGAEHPDLARVLNNLTNLYREQGKFDQAELVCQRALRIYEQAVGPEHPNIAGMLNNLANLYVDQGKFEQAESLYQQSLHIWEQAQGPDHPDVAHPLHGLANLYRKRGMDQPAELLYQRALAIRGQGLGEHHPETADILHDFAALQEGRKKYQEAAILYQRALAVREEVFGTGDPTTLETRTRYLALLQAMSEPT